MSGIFISWLFGGGALLYVALVLTAADIPGASLDEQALLIDGRHYCLVRFSRGQGADANMIAISAFAFLVDAGGRPVLRSSLRAIEGTGTATQAKPDSIDAARALAPVLKEQALQIAVADLLREIAVEAFNQGAGI